MSKSLKFRLPLAVVPLFAVAARCNIENQKASDVVTHTELPPGISSYANPQVSSASVASFLRRRQEHNTLRVAVIDNGVDYTHPELAGRVELDMEGDRVVGIGKDVMGDDWFAHPNLISPSLLAFGADDVVDGLIVGAAADPLGDLVALNAEFIRQLREAISSHEILKNSVFSKLTESSFTILGTKYLLALDKFNPTLYERMAAENDLLNAGSRTRAQAEGKKTNAEEESVLRLLVDSDWTMEAALGVPKTNLTFPSVTYFWLIEHADLFNEVLKQQYEAFAERSGFEQKLATFQKFIGSRTRTTDDAKVLKESLQVLQTSLYKQIVNFGDSDNFAGFVRVFCDYILPTEDYLKLRDSATPEAEKNDLAMQQLNKVFSWAQATNEYVMGNENVFSVLDRSRARTQMESFEEYKSRSVEYMLSRADISTFHCLKNNPELKGQVEHQRFGAAYTHPLLSSASNSVTHGTHVSGIIVSQSPNINIAPVRVTTQSMESTKEQRDRVQATFVSGFKTWLQNPLVIKGAREILAPFGLGNLSDAEFANAANDLFAVNIASSVEKNPLDFDFINQIVEAVNYVGERKIKVANISLGTSFSSAPASNLAPEDRANIGIIFDFLKFEYFKYTVGENVQKNAGETLFVIAAGNDGAWVDGRSRSALPCDLSSPYFSRFETENQKLPNNSVSNILCVGSIGPKDELSSFTNLTITNVPFILSYGESILSSIRTGDCTGVSEEFVKQNGGAPGFPDLESNDETRSFLIKMGLLDPNSTDIERDTFYATRLLSVGLSDVVAGVHAHRLSDHCVKNPVYEAHLSGTSMATPAVAGFIGRMIAGEMDAMGLREGEIWNHAHFKPKAIIERVFQNSPRYGGEVLISNVPKIVDIFGWNPSRLERTPMMLAHAAPQFFFFKK